MSFSEPPAKRRRSDVENVSNEKKNDRNFSELVFISGNTIHFMDSVNIYTIQQFIKFVDEKIRENVKHPDDEFNLTYVVHSGGGSVTDILVFVDFLTMTRKRYHNVKFTSVITGIAASAASIMSIVADNKHITKYAKAMIHELSSGMSRKNYTHIKSDFKLTTMYHDDLCQIYLENIRKDEKGEPVLNKEQLETLLRNETWYSADDYVKAGFADKVV